MESLPVEEDIIIKCGLEEMAKAFFKDYEIIWHDPNVNSEENQQYMAQLEKLCKVKSFAEWEEADKYIRNAKTICHVITSGTNGKLLVKEIFSSQNVPKILTFCRDEVSHSAWAKDYDKILCTATKIEDVISEIQKNLLEWQKQTSSLKFDLPAFAPIFDDRDKSQMNHLHLYLKVIPNFNNRAQAKKDFVSLSKGVYLDEESPKDIVHFERTYYEYNMEATLKWYTRQSFLYKMINNCLRIATSDSIQYCRLLLKDVERAIKDQYQKKSKEFNGLLYRGAYLSEEEWLNLKANMNKEIEMHGFLSVTKDEEVALNFVRGDPSKKVFITIIVPKGPTEGQGFAELEDFSDFKNEKEILFNVRSRFTVLETDDGGSKDSPYRHLVLLYGAQGLRKFVAEKSPLHQVEGIKNISGSRCQGPLSEMTEQMLFKSLRDPTKPIYSCKGCLDPKLGPFLCVPLKREMPTTIKGCLLTNSIQAQIPLYGYKCSQCGVRNQKGYFVCTDCNEKWCENCFENSLSCIQIGHSVLLETSPFSFWCEKMSENELNHLNFQKNSVSNDNPFQQARMYLQTHEYEKTIEYYSLYIHQKEAKGSKDLRLPEAYVNLGNLYENKGEYKKALEYYLEAVDISISIQGENHPTVAAAYNNIGMVYNRQEEYDKAIEYYFKSISIEMLFYGEDQSSVAASYNNIGTAYEAQGKYEKALDFHSKALKIDKLVCGESHPKVAISLNNLGSVSSKQGEYNKALNYYLKALDIDISVYGEIHPRVATTYTNIGMAYNNQKEFTKALDYHLKALDIKKTIYGENHPSLATVYNNIGLTFCNQGEDEKALDYFFKSLVIDIPVYGENHASVATTYTNIGMVYNNQKEYAKALDYHLKALGIEKSIYGENHHSLATVYNNLGLTYCNQGEDEKALEYFFKSLDTKKLAFGENHASVATTYSNIGMAYNNQKEYTKALDWYLKALNIEKSIYGENHHSTAIVYNNIGLAYSNQGEDEKALEYFFKSLDIKKLTHGENHANVANCYFNIGCVYGDQGNYEKALEYHLQCLNIRISVHGENHLSVGTSLKNLGIISEKLGEYEKALDFYLKSFIINKRIHGDHPETSDLSIKMSRVLPNVPDEVIKSVFESAKF